MIVKNLDKQEFKEILRTGDYDRLIGVIENDFFDCKNEIYHLKDEENKRELAKDVSSFANLEGGYILIGITTTRSVNHLRDEVTEIRLFERNLVDIDQYINVIRDWIYPEITGLKIEWKPSNSNVHKGIVVIEIPSQQETQKPFLIKKIIDSRKKSETMFGYAERKGDRSEPKKIEDIHRIVRDGLNYTKNIEKRFDNLETMLLSSHEQASADVPTKVEQNIQTGGKAEVVEDVDMYKLLHDRTYEIREAGQLSDKRTLILIAYPADVSTELKTLFTNAPGSIKLLLENPPKIRSGGWTLETRDIGKIIKGRSIRVAEWRKTIDLYKDGTLMLAADITNLLCHWPSSNTIKINPLAMIELTYNFVMFYNEILRDLTIQPEEVFFHFGFFNTWLDGTKNYLIPYAHNSLAQQLDENKKEVPEDNHFSEPLKCSTAVFNVGGISYLIVREIYLWFGIMPEGNNIPYTKTIDSTVIIDIEKIQAI